MSAYEVFGEHDDNTIGQIARTCEAEDAVGGVLMADGHLGYAMPVGGVVAYDAAVSPNGVGFDIACGNKAVRMNLKAGEIQGEMNGIMDRVYSEVAFGIGSKSEMHKDHELFDDVRWGALPWANDNRYAGNMKDKFRAQLGSVGSGNHYVDIFRDENADVWVGVHFGSRGLGHNICTAFMNLANGMKWNDRPRGEKMEAPPTVIKLDTLLGGDYWSSMMLAGGFAYAGRDIVCQQVADILGAEIVEEVHNHHNYAWLEKHNGEEVIVVRKGATPAFPGQRGFVGGSMGDDAVIVRGADTPSYAQSVSYFSTVHGAGRVMSRTRAAGKVKWQRVDGGPKRPVRVSAGEISEADMRQWVTDKCVVLRGAGCDEAPQAYRRLPDVLKHHEGTIEVEHTLTPMGVAMAGADVYDPWKD